MAICPHHSWAADLDHRSARNKVILHLKKRQILSNKSIRLKLEITLDINASRQQVESVDHDICLQLDSFQRELCGALSLVSSHSQLHLISQTLR